MCIRSTYPTHKTCSTVDRVRHTYMRFPPSNMNHSINAVDNTDQESYLLQKIYIMKWEWMICIMCPSCHGTIEPVSNCFPFVLWRCFVRHRPTSVSLLRCPCRAPPVPDHGLQPRKVHDERLVSSYRGYAAIDRTGAPREGECWTAFYCIRLTLFSGNKSGWPGWRLRSRIGDKSHEIWLVCPQNGTAVLKGLTHYRWSSIPNIVLQLFVKCTYVPWYASGVVHRVALSIPLHKKIKFLRDSLIV